MEFTKNLNQVDNPEAFTLEMLFMLILVRVEKSYLLSVPWKKIVFLFLRNGVRCLEVLQRIEPDILLLLDQLKANAAGYYHKIFDDAGDRLLCCDIGYSGSISKGLNAILKKRAR